MRAGLQIDQHVPAGNQIEPREGRVSQEIVDREGHSVAQIANNAKTATLLDKKPAQAFRAYLRFGLLSINACACKNDRVGVHVGCKDLKLDGALRSRNRFQKKDCKAISFLAGAAAGDQMRSGLSGGCTATISGMMLSASASKAAASRKNSVTLMRRS